MNDFGNCETIIKSSKIALSEKMSKITFVNNNRIKVRKIKIDGCVIDNDEIRCDYLIARKQEEEIYVELKGSNVSHALDQIINTISLISENIKVLPKLCFIITTRCPLSSPEIQQQQLIFKKKYNSSLIIKNSPAEFVLS